MREFGTDKELDEGVPEHQPRASLGAKSQDHRQAEEDGGPVVVKDEPMEEGAGAEAEKEDEVSEASRAVDLNQSASTIAIRPGARRDDNLGDKDYRYHLEHTPISRTYTEAELEILGEQKAEIEEEAARAQEEMSKQAPNVEILEHYKQKRGEYTQKE